LPLSLSCINADNSKCRSNVKEALKKLRSEVALMVALMAMEKEKKRSVASSHGVATALKKLEKST
jgi:HEAT repeat protein